MHLISIEPFYKRLPRLFCNNCNEKPPMVKAYGEENGVPINMILCHDCLDLARDGQIQVLKRPAANDKQQTLFGSAPPEALK